MDTSKFWRQQDIANPEKMKYPVKVIGAGAIGSCAVFGAAKLGLRDIEVYDFDKVEAHNPPNQLFKDSDFGKSKVQALKDLVVDFDEFEIKTKEEKFIAQPLEGFVVCGVDSMDARHEIWKKVKFNMKVPFFIDARMGGEVMRIYTINPLDVDDIKLYEDTLYTSKDAVELKCTERAVIYNVFVIGGLILNQLKKVMLAEEYDRELIFDLKTMTFLKRR